MITFLASAPLFGPKHLIGVAVVLVLVVLALFLVKKYQPKSFIVLLVVTVLFYVLEIIKQVESGWPQSHLPFHLCSFPLYLYPLVTFVKNEKVRSYILPAAYATVLFGGLIAVLYPSNILGGELTWACVEGNKLPYVAFIYHGIMIFAPIYLIVSGIYKITIPKLLKAFPATLLFMFSAIIVNEITDKDFMLLKYGNGSPFQFVYDINPILYTVVMILLGIFAVSLFHVITCLIVKNKEV